MKAAIIIACLCLTGCAYSGPKLQLQVGFMGANVGVTLGSDPATVILPPTQAFKK